MSIKSVFKPEGSLTAGLATVGLVYGIYQSHVGNLAVARATDPLGAEAGALAGERRKAGWTSLVAVSGVSLLAKDPTVFVLGAGAIMAMEIHTRHAIMTDPNTNAIIPPGPGAYQPAGVTVPAALQGTSG